MFYWLTIPSYPCGSNRTMLLCLIHLSWPLLMNWSIIHCKKVWRRMNAFCTASHNINMKYCIPALCYWNLQIELPNRPKNLGSSYCSQVRNLKRMCGHSVNTHYITTRRNKTRLELLRIRCLRKHQNLWSYLARRIPTGNCCTRYISPDPLIVHWEEHTSLYRVFDHEGHDDDDYKKKPRL